MTSHTGAEDNWLVDGEAISFESAATSAAPMLSDDQINEKYVKGEIRIVTEQARYPISSVAGIVDDPSYKISPEYQRRHRWANDRKSKLIESLIMNVPIPPIFLYEYEYSKYEVMDGLQRLTAIHEFYKGKFSLEGLVEWTELNGRTYGNLPAKVREGIDRRYLSSVILLKETAKDETEALRLKQLVFERINSGGVRLEPQETRNAIFDGKLNQLCIALSRNTALCRLWGIPESQPDETTGGPPSEERVNHDLFREMGDVELVLRYFAYRQKQRLQRSGESLKTYHDNFLRKGNFLAEVTLGNMGEDFKAAISLAAELFSDRAFYLFRKRTSAGGDNWSWLERPTTTVYDPLMFILTKMASDRAALIGKACAIRAGMEEFYKSNYDVFEGRNVNPSALTQREGKFEEFFRQHLTK
jgi:Protein of unknown function DUF262